MQYRREIDGLRAIAVVPVVLFHAGYESFGGGYVGVDVFFVISGFLITSIIISNLDKNSFSLLQFYERRARRILPALFFVVLCCLPVAWSLLLPDDLKNFAQSLVAMATFSSNVLFWMESGYFDTAAELKPLLHTWSLAVEEQFYILFPLLLMGLWRFGTSTVAGALVLITILSLSAAQYSVESTPDAVFFLPHTRAWELSIGALAALYLHKNIISTPPWLNQFLATTGLAAILWSVLAYDHDTPFPSLYALVPTMGTLLIILFAQEGTQVHRLLSLRPFVALGLISYSLYLWHQPLFAFWRYQRFLDTAPWEMPALIALSVVLAGVSYLLIERPARTSKAARGRVLTLAVTGCALCAAIGLAGHVKDGFPDRLDERAAIFSDMEYYRSTHWRDYSIFGNPEQEMVSELPANRTNVLVIGNSWGFDIANALARNTDMNVAYWGMTGHRCNAFTLPAVDRSSAAYEQLARLCGNNIQRFSEVPKNTSLVVLADNHFAAGQYDNPEVRAAFEHNLATLQEQFSGPVLLVKGRPVWGFDGGYNVAQKLDEISAAANENLQRLLSPWGRINPDTEQYYRNFFASYGVTFATLFDPLCPVTEPGSTTQICKLLGDDTVFYFDGEHLTIEGGQQITGYLEALITKALLAQ